MIDNFKRLQNIVSNQLGIDPIKIKPEAEFGKEVDQKETFIGEDQGPASRAEVIHLYNFKKIRNRTEVPVLMQAVLNGAEQVAYISGIMFLNYE